MSNKKILIHSHDLTIKFQGRDITQFEISPIPPAQEYQFLDWDTKDDSQRGNKPFHSDYNFVDISIDVSVPEAPRYKVVQMLKESENDNPIVIRQRWFPMNTTILEIVEEEREEAKTG